MGNPPKIAIDVSAACCSSSSTRCPAASECQIRMKEHAQYMRASHAPHIWSVTAWRVLFSFPTLTSSTASGTTGCSSIYMTIAVTSLLSQAAPTPVPSSVSFRAATSLAPCPPTFAAMAAYPAAALVYAAVALDSAAVTSLRLCSRDSGLCCPPCVFYRRHSCTLLDNRRRICSCRHGDFFLGRSSCLYDSDSPHNVLGVATWWHRGGMNSGG